MFSPVPNLTSNLLGLLFRTPEKTTTTSYFPSKCLFNSSAKPRIFRKMVLSRPYKGVSTFPKGRPTQLLFPGEAFFSWGQLQEASQREKHRPSLENCQRDVCGCERQHGNLTKGSLQWVLPIVSNSLFPFASCFGLGSQLPCFVLNPALMD